MCTSTLWAIIYFDILSWKVNKTPPLCSAKLANQSLMSRNWCTDPFISRWVWLRVNLTASRKQNCVFEPQSISGTSWLKLIYHLRPKRAQTLWIMQFPWFDLWILFSAVLPSVFNHVPQVISELCLESLIITLIPQKLFLPRAFSSRSAADEAQQQVLRSHLRYCFLAVSSECKMWCSDVSVLSQLFG